jgi:predicted nucleotidyltransferase
MTNPKVPGLFGHQVELLREWASANPRVARLRVFGSRARGDHRAYSDVDLAVDLTESPRDNAEGLWVASHAKWNDELSALLDLDVRVVRLTDDDDGGIGPGVESESIVIWISGTDSDHLTSPDPNRSPYAHTSDEDLLAAYERVAADPDAPDAPVMLAEMQRRGLAE